MATQNGSIQNDTLATAVRQMLLQYTPLRVSGQGIQVNVRNGSVTLSGAVRSLATKETAGQLACKLRGVRAVDNQLTADGDVEVAVATALASDERTRAGFPGILVGVVYGVAYLKGTVTSPEIKNAAGDIAAKIKGVLRVSNELIAPAAQAVKPATAKAS